MSTCEHERLTAVVIFSRTSKQRIVMYTFSCKINTIVTSVDVSILIF
jgi:hypothetical protein